MIESISKFQETRLSRVSSGIRDGTHGTFTRVDEGRPFLSAKNVRDGYIHDSGAESLISQTDFDEIVKNGYPRAGDVLLTIVGSIGRTAVFQGNEPSAFQRSVAFVRPLPIINPSYLSYQFAAPHFQDQLVLGTKTSAQPGIYLGDLAACTIFVPSLAAQTEIVEYLDRETAEIDAFIADQEELIGLLAERRAATISHAVTKGLDPMVPMKDSGVEWLGGIPEHWNCTRMSRFFDVTLGKMLDAGKAVSEDALVLPYIRAANIQEAGLDLTSVNQMPFTRSEARSFDIRQGDLLVVEGGAVGVNAYMDQDLSGWSFQKTVNRVRPTSVGVNSKFLGYAVDALRWAGVIEMISNKSTIAHLTAEKLERLVLAFPAREEQDAIASFLDNETAELNAVIADAKEAIALSRERRAALISAAVTGKIDVREHGAVA